MSTSSDYRFASFKHGKIAELYSDGWIRIDDGYENSLAFDTVDELEEIVKWIKGQNERTEI